MQPSLKTLGSILVLLVSLETYLTKVASTHVLFLINVFSSLCLIISVTWSTVLSSGPVYRLCSQCYPFCLEKVKVAQSCLTLRPHGLYSLWNSLGQNTGVGSRSLLQGISQPRDCTQACRIVRRFFTN